MPVLSMNNYQQMPNQSEPYSTASAFPGTAPANSGFFSVTEEKNTEKKKKTTTTKKRKKYIKEFVLLFARAGLLLLVVYVLFFHITGILKVPNNDMHPRIDAGDMVLYYRLEKIIQARDVIVFSVPSEKLVVPADNENEAPISYTASDKTEKSGFVKFVEGFDRAIKKFLGKNTVPENAEIFVSRVVGAPGDIVEINDDERLVVNRNVQVESDIFYSTPQYLGFTKYPVLLGEGEYFVLADSRQGGTDSRFFGVVNEADILGTVITVVRRNNL